MKKITIIDFVLIFLALLLFSTNTKLFYYLNENWETYGKFSLQKINPIAIESIVYALPFSAITALLLKLLDNNVKSFIVMVSWFALIDGIGVYIFHNTEIQHFTVFTSWYFGVYTFSIIESIGLYYFLNKKTKGLQPVNQVNKALTTSEQIKQLSTQDSTLSQQQIADKLNISKSYVSRVLKKETQIINN